MPDTPALTELTIAEEAAAWERLGFAVDGGAMTLGAVCVRFEGTGGGIAACGLDGAQLDGGLDGLAAHASTPPEPAAGAHPNGAIAIDHVVVATPDFERTTAALEAAGMPLRRVRETGDPARPFRQGFRRIGAAVLELVEQLDGEPGPARFWGLVVVVRELEPLGELLGELIGTPRDAVQPGRRIATVRSRAAGIATALAFMTPEPGR
jgi:hypothetical protein